MKRFNLAAPLMKAKCAPCRSPPLLHLNGTDTSEFQGCKRGKYSTFELSRSINTPRMEHHMLPELFVSKTLIPG